MAVKPVINKKGIQRQGTITETCGMYSSGRGITDLKTNQFYNKENTFEASIKDAFTHASKSLGLTASISESNSTSYTQNTTMHGGMLGPNYIAKSIFDGCKKKGSYCFISNDSGSGVFISGSFTHFTTGSKTDPDTKEIYTNFVDYVDQKIVHKLSTQMVAHIGIVGIRNTLTGSVSASATDLKTLTEAL
tara:strand:+ start:160 stop:729 length:570 start_codon:yes stop_codon:yes gene_type:complete